MRTSPRLSLRLLGGFEVLRDGRPLSDRCHGKMRALLAYLAVESAQVHTRQALGALLWPEQDEDHARQSLRQALTSLRSVLGDRDGPTSVFRVNRESVSLNPDSAHDIDVAVLEPVAPAGCKPGAIRSRAACRQCHQVAAAHYHGPFLAGLSVPDAPEFESWLACKRQWFGRRAADAFAHLAACYEQSGDPQRALQYAHAQLRVDPWNEEAHRQVMRLLTVGGRRYAALEHYRHLRTRLADELGVDPEDETRALYERARAGLIPPVGGLPVERLLPPEISAPRVCPSALPGHGGERRVLTVLSCEARCAVDEDPEVLHERSSRYLAAVTSVVRRHGGYVVESDGVGLTAYFGYPQFCEQPSLQAVRAAAAVRDCSAGGQRLRSRVHTDLVFVPPRRQAACDTDASIVGAAPRVARLMHGVASDIALAISANTYSLVRDAVECRLLQSQALPGAGEPIVLHEVIRVLEGGRSGPAASDPASGVCGPQAEWAELAADWKPGEEIPLKITEQVDVMLDRLGRSRPLVQLASSLGPEFSERQLAGMLSQVRNLGLDPLTLATELERLVSAGIFDSWTEASVTRYRFRQPMVRGVAYGSQSRDQQRLYERLLADLRAAGVAAPLGKQQPR
jgi:DNA-binding SARP family transcriptional activator/class 3 adenylate cyclase